MLRVVLVVLLAVGVVGASLPAVERARVASTDTRLEGEVSSLRTALADLLARDDPGAGARRVVTLRVPARSWGHAGVARLAVGVGDTRSERVVWRTRGGRERSVRLPVPVDARDGDAFRVAAAGRHRLMLALRTGPGGPVVVARHLGGQADMPGARRMVTPRGRTARSASGPTGPRSRCARRGGRSVPGCVSSRWRRRTRTGRPRYASRPPHRQEQREQGRPGRPAGPARASLCTLGGSVTLVKSPGLVQHRTGEATARPGGDPMLTSTRPQKVA